MEIQVGDSISFRSVSDPENFGYNMFTVSAFDEQKRPIIHASSGDVVVDFVRITKVNGSYVNLAPNGKSKVETVVEWEDGANPALIVGNILLFMRRDGWSMDERQAFINRVRATSYEELLLLLREYAVIESDDDEEMPYEERTVDRRVDTERYR